MWVLEQEHFSDTSETTFFLKEFYQNKSLSLVHVPSTAKLSILRFEDNCNHWFLIFFFCFGFRNSFIDILRAILLSLEVLIEDQELQINGFILIIDWSNFSFKQASKLTPSILKLAIEGLQVGGG